MKIVRQLITGLILLIALPCAAMTLSEAKNAGYVGEQANGYLGIVDNNVPADAKSLVSDINKKRRSYYQDIAKNHGIGINEVETMAGEKVISSTPKGQYIKRAYGTWEKK